MRREDSKMTIRFMLMLWAMSLASPCIAGGQEIRRAIIEEIQAAPAEREGQWVIGSRQFTVNASTIIHPGFPAEVGSLAIVEFVERNGDLVATQIQPQGIRAEDIDDGPYVFWRDSTTAEIITMEGGQVERKLVKDIRTPREIKDLPRFESSVVLDPASPTPPKSSWDAPARLLAISDLEGNYKNALRFLQNNDVLDENGHWDWGDGHLVLIGDLIDRGSMVTELMWLIRRIEREAQTSGGQVHYVLGNHEAMVMAGDLRYIVPKYHFVSGRIGKTYDQLYAANSDIGRWWRSKNGVMRIGNLLFAHGGYSPLLDSAGLDMDTLNQRIREGLAPAQPTGVTAATNPVRHQHGPFWYRGYFSQYAPEWGGKATPEEIKRILDRHNAEHIVIGHTLVREVGPLDDTGAVIAIDIEWKDSTKCQGLLQENGQLWRLTMTAERELLQVGATDKEKADQRDAKEQ